MAAELRLLQTALLDAIQSQARKERPRKATRRQRPPDEDVHEQAFQTVLGHRLNRAAPLVADGKAPAEGEHPEADPPWSVSKRDERDEAAKRKDVDWRAVRDKPIVQLLKSMSASELSSTHAAARLLGLERLCWSEGARQPGSALAGLVLGTPFSIVVCLLIVANTVWMVLHANEDMHRAVHGGTVPAFYEQGDRFFNYVFALELSLRLVALRAWFFLCPEWQWNLLDLFLVLSSFLAEVFGGDGVNFFRLLRANRAIKVLRIIRVMRFFRELRIMVCSVIAATRSLLWAFSLLFAMIAMFGIFFMQAGAVYYQDPQADPDVKADIATYFGSIGKTMWYMFLSISGGCDWGEVARPLGAISFVFEFIFLGYIIFVVFGMLNVLVGVFVCNACQSLDRDLVVQLELEDKRRFIAEMLAMFHELLEDVNMDGHPGGRSISWEEFRQHVASEEVQAYLQSHDLYCGDLYRLFHLMDTDGSEDVNLLEFVHGCLHLKGHARCSDVALLVAETRDVQRELRWLQREVSRGSKAELEHAEERL